MGGHEYTAEQLAERYQCGECGKTIGVAEVDRNLIANWIFCDECGAALMRNYEADMARKEREARGGGER